MNKGPQHPEWAGERIVRLRKVRGWNQTDLARKLSIYMGRDVPSSYISLWEKNKKGPSSFVKALERLELEGAH